MALPRLPWPLPALAAWGLAWGLFAGLRAAGAPGWAALALACLAGVLASVWAAGWWRRLCIAMGFPLSLALSGAALLPAWAWLLPLGLGLLVYPLNVWRDAPLFPTPRHALRALPALAPLPPGALALDAGCGLGDGLRALRDAYPAARLHGMEWSWPLRLMCALRCPWAQVWRGDLWRIDWGPYALVYMFQRPESMERAALKAQAQLRPGAWLASLEFEALEWEYTALAHAPDGRPIWLYRMPMQSRAELS